MVPAVDQLEAAPVTVTVPTPPGRLPIVPKESANVPPFWIVSIPVLFAPMVRFRANAPGSLITVAFGVTVLMFPSVVCLGKPASQLPLKNQLEETAPVQLVWACIETVEAVKSAIPASNLGGTNLQPPAPDVARRRGPMDDSRRGSHLMSPQSLGASLPRRREQNLDPQTERANQESHNLPPDCRNCGDGECSFVFEVADALPPRNRQPY